MLRVGTLLTCWLWAASATAQTAVTAVIAATSDVWDVAVTPTRTLVATSGGLVELVGDRVVRVVGTREGLPGQRTRSVSVVGDSAWVGTVEGLAEVVWAEDGLPRVARRVDLPRVARVALWQGALWAASHGRGLFRIDPAGGAPAPVPLGRSQDLARPTDLLPRGEELWIATAGAGIVRLGTDGVPRGTAGGRTSLVWALEPAGDLVLAATSGGLVAIGPDGRVRGGNRIFGSAPQGEPSDTEADSRSRSERPAAKNSPGRSGVRRENGGRGGREPHALDDGRGGREPHALDVVPDVRAVTTSGGSTWIGTFGAGVFRIAGGRAVPVRCDRCDRVRALATSSAGVVVGHDAGLARTGGDRARPVALGGLPSSNVTALARAFGSIWIGTFDHGLARLDRGRPVAVDRATERWGMDGRVNDLAVTVDAQGQETLWIATARGLWAHDGLRFWPVETPGSPGRGYVMDLHVDPASGALWVASSTSLGRLSSGAWTSWNSAAGRPLEKLHAVTTDREGRVWIGALHGLYVLDEQSGTFLRLTVSSGALPMDWVTALAPWGDGIVAGTYAGGLVWFDGRSFTTEREAPRGSPAGALPSGWVNPHAIAARGGTFLVGTPGAGLLVGHAGAWQRFGVPAGLPADDVTAVLEDGSDGLWVATRGGLARLRLPPP